MIRETSSTPRFTAPTAAKAAAGAAAPAAAASAADQLSVTSRVDRMSKMPVLFQTDIIGLQDTLQSGKLITTRNSTFSLGNLNGWTRQDGAAVVLSDEGKRFLAEKGGEGLDWALDDVAKAQGYGGPFGQRANVSETLDLGKHVEQILVNEDAFEGLAKDFEAKLAKGEIPEKIAGKPAKEFFDSVVTKTDDIMAQLEAKAFGLQVPGFAELPQFAHKPAAMLAGRVANKYPREVPMDLRRQIAFSKIDVTNLAWNDLRLGFKNRPNVKEFHHGTTMKWMAYTAFKGDLESMYNGLSETNRTRVNEFMKKRTGKEISFVSAYGSGVYTGNASVASGYAYNKLSRRAGEEQNPVHIISGLLDAGKETLEDLDKAIPEDPSIHTRLVPNGGQEGPYRVTRGAEHFQIKGVTSFDPNIHDPKTIPLLLKAQAYDPDWAAGMLARMEPDTVKRALEHHAAKGDDTIKAAAKDLLDRVGKKAAEVGGNTVEKAAQEAVQEGGLMKAIRKGFQRII